jgi:16S rRNA (cytidine1402-2'-O)-methyltransferase
MSGQLYLVTTPIGNLEDITIRAINTLKEVDYIAAEDTRHSIKLLNHYNIKKPLVSYHEHNKFKKGMEIVNDLKKGMSVALITDAGTPAISDPGEDLVKLCYNNNIKVTSSPGVAALIVGLTLSGLNTRRFVFEGFLSQDKKERKQILENLKKEPRTIILYEAPHKLKNTLNDLYKVLGNRNIAITRELTKKYEDIYNTTIEEAILEYKTSEPRGEYVLIIEGILFEDLKQEEIDIWTNMSLEDHMQYYVNLGMNKKEIIKKIAKDRNSPKREIYNYFNKE